VKNMTIGQQITYVIAVLVLIAIFVKLADKYVTVPVVQQIFQAIADMFTGAAK
jgi:hypothetical protein